MPDPDAVGEERFIALAPDPTGRVLVTVFTYVGPTFGLSPHAGPVLESGNATRDANAQAVRLFQG
jgi:hypothetical protein